MNPPIRLVSTTLTANSESIIEEALLSVLPWVDACLLIDTGVTDGTLRIARKIAGDKYLERQFTWTNDFSEARNFALQAAFEAGATWAVTLDTDERLLLNGEPIREQLARAPGGVFMVTSEDATYSKERFFRIPTHVRWRGPTHESFAAFEVGSATLPRMRFRELPKSAESALAKFERDALILARYTEEHPNDPRWHYYLGESLKNLGKHDEAVAAYDQCAALRGWNEESAWACYRSAESLCALGRFRDAIDRCAAGLARHAGIAELAWLAGYSAYQSGDALQATYWARLAIAGGHFEGAGKLVPRIGFSHPPALYEGPYDILRYALPVLGDTKGAEEAQRKYEGARRARESAAGVAFRD
jgi:tetratricopeptide (TPR) repeat protein